MHLVGSGHWKHSVQLKLSEAESVLTMLRRTIPIVFFQPLFNQKTSHLSHSMRPIFVQPFLRRYISWYLSPGLTCINICAKRRLCSLCFQVAGTPFIWSFFHGGCHSMVHEIGASCVMFWRNKCAVPESKSSRGPDSAPMQSRAHCCWLCLQACLCCCFAPCESKGM